MNNKKLNISQQCLHSSTPRFCVQITTAYSSLAQGWGICLLLIIATLISGCVSTLQEENHLIPPLRYVGSSTIANFIHDAEPVYGRARFVVDTEPESVGGEIAICEGRADIAGVAGKPRQETLEIGVRATLIGKDAIAVIVNQTNPISNLTREQLKGIFTGKFHNWKELGGPDLEIYPFIVGPESATRKVFRSVILQKADYTGCEVVSPDADIPMRVESSPGGIGQISFSFLESCGHVKTLAVEGQEPVPTNPNYPITRPLYLLWWPGRTRVAEFVEWTGTTEARNVLLKRFARAKAIKNHEPPEKL